MSQRTVTNVRLPDSLTSWYFESFEEPMSTTLSELLQLFQDVAQQQELYAADEVLARMREMFEDY